MSDPQAAVFDLIAGRWRSQSIYAAVKIGVFDVVRSEPTSARVVAAELGLDAAMTYRLLRALGSVGLLAEHENERFTLTAAGELLAADHPQTLRGIVLLREGPEHYAVWKHLPAIVRDGARSGFEREFGTTAFDYAAHEPAYAAAFDGGMSSYSRVQTGWVLDAFGPDDFASIAHVCDIGGGHGHLLCHLLVRYPHLTGTVLERPGALADAQMLWAKQLDVSDRCRYVGGDMFTDVPAADAYFMKMILHNWNDDECVRILRTVLGKANRGGRIYIVEHVIPVFDIPHIAKLFDLHMMTWGPGRERTQHEYIDLLSEAGWNYVAARYPPGAAIGVIEGHKTER